MKEHETTTAPLGGAPREAETVTARVRRDWRYRHEYAIEHRRYVTDQLTGDLDTAMARTESVLSDLGTRGSAGVWLENDSLLAIRHVLVALAAATARVVELCDALEIIEGDCLRNSDDPVTTLFHIYTTARAALRQEEPRE